MHIFKSYTYTWEQLGVFKLALLSIGTIIGSLWHEFFSAHMTVVVIVAISSLAYTTYASLTQ